MKSIEIRDSRFIFHEEFENNRVLILNLKNENLVFSGRRLIDHRQLYRNRSEKCAAYVEKIAVFSSISVHIFIILVYTA